MSSVASLSRHRFFSEFNDPQQTSSGWISPAEIKRRARVNLGVEDEDGNATGGTAVTTSDITSAGGNIVIPAGTSVTDALQTIADAADPVAP